MSAHRAFQTMTGVRPDTLELPGLIIEVTQPDEPRIEAELGVHPVVVGTSGDADVTLVDPRVSRRHCEIALTERGIVVRDLASKNGTFLGDTEIVEAVIQPGRSVEIGDSTLTVRPAGVASVLPLSPDVHFGRALGGSLAMRALFAQLERAAATTETILLRGESGTGKELLAEGIHQQSPRRGGPFVVFDCAAIAPSLVEVELFGCVRGAFTGADRARAGLFEQANGGTLFIDEVGELPLDLQPKLLRALESRQIRRLGAPETVGVDVRVVAATHRDLKKRVAAGAFRDDLYYRLSVVRAVVPPLRERREDLPLLVERFLAQHSPPRTLDDLPANALDLLRAHRWPGNVRELRNTVVRLVMFPFLGENAIEQATPEREDGVSALASLPLRAAREAAVEQFERSYLRTKLRENEGNVTRTAESMGVTRQFVHRLMDRHQIKSDD